MDSQWVELRVRSVRIEGVEATPLVLLEDGACRHRLRVPVGPFEASAVIMELEGISPPRPMTHDLLAELFREAGFHLDRVELFGSQDESPRARLSYRRGLKKVVKEIRPSDALALALRLRAPILAERTLVGTPQRSRRAAFGRRTARVLLLDEWRQRFTRG